MHKFAASKSFDDLFTDTEDKDKFHEWWRNQKDTIKWFARQPNTAQILVWAFAEYRSDRGLAQLADATDVIKSLREYIDRALPLERKRGEIDGEIATLTKYSDVIDARERLEDTLAMGRKKATEKRKERAVEKQAALKKGIADLFNHPDTANLTYDEMSEFLSKRIGYEKSTIKQAIKREAPQLKAAKKNRLPK